MKTEPTNKKLYADTRIACEEYYARRKSESVRRGQKKAKMEGRTTHLAPTGYEHDHRRKVVVRDPVLFPIIQGLFDMFLTGNYTIGELVRTANSKKFRTKTGKRMTPAMLRRMLKNPYNAGKIAHTENGITTYYKGLHEPIVTEEEFKKIQKLLGPDTDDGANTPVVV